VETDERRMESLKVSGKGDLIEERMKKGTGRGTSTGDCR
jgi:hypothetical protein